MRFSQDTFDWEVVQVNKRPTRLAESTFFSFVPAPASAQPEGWTLQVLGSQMNPTDTLGKQGEKTGFLRHLYIKVMILPRQARDKHRENSKKARFVEGSSYLDSTYGGSPHLRGVEAARWHGDAGAFTLTSLDVPIICTGKASPFVTPRTQPPDMSLGVHWNIFQNM